MNSCDHMALCKGEKNGPTRLIYENCIGLNPCFNNNDKLDKTKGIINKLEADVVAYSEHRIN